MKTEKNVLGSCPVCGKGQIVKNSNGYSCNYFKTLDDKCTFTIYPFYFGKEVTDKIVMQLIKDGHTDVFSDLKTKEGKTFSAKLVIEDGFVKPSFYNKHLNTRCPICSEEVVVLRNGFACRNFYKDENEMRKCTFFMPKFICEKEITEENAERLIKSRKTGIIEGFKNKQGDIFSSRLTLNSDFALEFDSILCQCPKCGGNIYQGSKAYNCSNYKNESIKCNFVIWREIHGRTITAEEAILLCEKRVTPILSGFKTKDGKVYEKQLILDEEYKVIFM